MRSSGDIASSKKFLVDVYFSVAKIHFKETGITKVYGTQYA